VQPVWQRLAERATFFGRPVPKVEAVCDPRLHVVANGRTIWPIHSEDGLFIFVLPKAEAEVRLVSRAGSPTDTRPWLDDRRRLGVYVERILLRGASELREVPLDHPDLARGWWAVEREGLVLRRWTDGDAALPLPKSRGPTILEIRAGGAGMTYVIEAGRDRLAA
jgi:hypothetical protein